MNFTYDPESGLTPWPLAWQIVPEKYNWVGAVGEFITFSVKAIPDPTYPDAWGEHYAPAPDDGSVGGGIVVPAPPLPPQPVVSEYLVIEGTDVEPEYFTLTTEGGLVLDAVDAKLFFPYKDIRYIKGGEEFSAQIPQEVIDDNYDYVVALVPDSRESIDKRIVLEVVSDSEEPLSGTFWFQINNDWSEARSLLEVMTEHSKAYFEEFSSQYGDGATEDNSPPADNTVSESVLEPSQPTVDDVETETFESEYGQNYDDLYREENPEEINKVVEEEGGIDNHLDRMKTENDSGNEAEAEVESPSNDPDFSMDEALRNGNIEDVMIKYGLTYEEVITMMRNM